MGATASQIALTPALGHADEQQATDRPGARAAARCRPAAPAGRWWCRRAPRRSAAAPGSSPPRPAERQQQREVGHRQRARRAGSTPALWSHVSRTAAWTERRAPTISAAPAMVTSSPTSHGTATATVLRIGRECSLGSNSSSSRLTRWCQTSAYTPSVTAAAGRPAAAERGVPTGPNSGWRPRVRRREPPPPPARRTAARPGGGRRCAEQRRAPLGGVCGKDQTGQILARWLAPARRPSPRWCRVPACPGGAREHRRRRSSAGSDCGPAGSCAAMSAMVSSPSNVVVAPGTGFEPVTLRLTAACSTAELTRNEWSGSRVGSSACVRPPVYGAHVRATVECATRESRAAGGCARDGAACAAPWPRSGGCARG